MNFLSLWLLQPDTASRWFLLTSITFHFYLPWLGETPVHISANHLLSKLFVSDNGYLLNFVLMFTHKLLSCIVCASSVSVWWFVDGWWASRVLSAQGNDDSWLRFCWCEQSSHLLPLSSPFWCQMSSFDGSTENARITDEEVCRSCNQCTAQSPKMSAECQRLYLAPLPWASHSQSVSWQSKNSKPELSDHDDV